MDTQKRKMHIRKNDWLAAFCGVLFICFFLFASVYRSWEVQLSGVKLLGAAPLAWVMIACGLCMVVCPLVDKRRITLWVGLGCIALVVLFGLLGNVVLGSEKILERLHIHNNYAGYRAVHTETDTGYIFCLVCCGLFCLLTFFADWVHPRGRHLQKEMENHVYRDRNGNEIAM